MSGLIGIETKLERANHHLREFQSALRSFYESNPYIVAAKRDPDSRKPVYYLAAVRPVPPAIPILAGEVIQSLRTVLDYVSYELVVLGSQAAGPFDYVCYPIFKSADNYKIARLGKVKGARQQAIDAIDATRPYKGGNDLFWVIDKLNVVDKHRLLITAGGRFDSVDIMPSMVELFRQTAVAPEFERLHLASADAMAGMQVFLRPADHLFPLEPGDKLYIDRPDAEMNEKIQFRVSVAVSEPGIAEPVPLGDLLIAMTRFVDNVVGLLMPHFTSTFGSLRPSLGY